MIATDTYDLVKRALNGERRAQQALARRLSPIIRARIARRLRALDRLDEATVEDLSQELWSRLFQPDRPLLAKWEPGGLSLENYVGRAAEWEVGQKQRTEKAEKRQARPIELSPELASDVDVEKNIVDRDLARHLFARLETELPPRGRWVLALLYRDHLSPDEAAGVLEVKRQVIDNWLHRIRTRAREILDGQ